MPTVSQEYERIKKRLSSAGVENLALWKCASEDAVHAAWQKLNLLTAGEPPLLHQEVAEVLGCRFLRFGCFLDKGLGKSRVGLDVFAWRRWQVREKDTTASFSALVLCPNQVHVENWSQQIRKYAPWATVNLCPALPDAKREFVEQLLGGGLNRDITVIDYHSLQTMLTVKGSKKFLADLPKSRRLGQLFQFLIMDESQHLKEWKTLRYAMLSEIVSSIPYRMLCTGTLFNQDPQEVWPQFFLLDGGQTFGKYLTVFRLLFCKKVKDHFAYQGFVWQFDEDKQEDFQRLLQSVSIHYSVEDCVKLPALRFVKPELKMTDEIAQFYRSTIKEAVQRKIECPIEAVNIFQKLRRILSGFLTVEKEHVALSYSPKLEWLKEKLCSWDEPVVIFYEFTKTGEQITESVQAASKCVGWLYSGCKEKQKVLKAWTKGDLDVLVIQNSVGAEGLNLQRSRRAVFYECPLSAITRAQAEARIWRLGQTQVSYIYDLFFSNTVEAKILQHVRDGMSLHKAVVCETVAVEARDLF